MGTRGLTGFVVDGAVKASYQQFDSYPAGVGRDVLAFVDTVNQRIGNWDEVKELARQLTVVDEEGDPTAEQLAELTDWASYRT